ncbi:MAG TPA: hypothetical protein VL357_11935 [Rariglobus sp.]|jgi:hypothetical protein|nr:hypothetical protein [Rariglobus sp.]
MIASDLKRSPKMKKTLVIAFAFLIGSVVGFLAAQPTQKQKDEQYAAQVRRLADMGLVAQKRGPQAATLLLAACSELSLALGGDMAKRDISTSLIAFSRLAGTQLHPWPITPTTKVDEIAVQKRIEEFRNVLQAEKEANQSPEPMPMAVTPPAAQASRQP